MSMKKIWGKRENLKERRMKAKKMLEKDYISSAEYQHICELEEQTLNQIVLRNKKVL